jgi:hypothetical protein
VVNSIPSRLLNSSAGGRERRQYEVAGSIGLKVARRISKSPEVVVARDSISDSSAEGIVEKRSDSVFASTDHRVEITTTAPTTEPTKSPAAAHPPTEPTSLSPGVSKNEQPKSSACVRERQERREEIGGVATKTC